MYIYVQIGTRTCTVYCLNITRNILYIYIYVCIYVCMYMYIENMTVHLIYIYFGNNNACLLMYHIFAQ